MSAVMSSASSPETAVIRARFAVMVRSRRQVAGMTQRQLAELSGLGVRTLRDLERARVTRPQRSTVELLADAFGLTGPTRQAFVDLVRPGVVRPPKLTRGGHRP